MGWMKFNSLNIRILSRYSMISVTIKIELNMFLCLNKFNKFRLYIMKNIFKPPLMSTSNFIASIDINSVLALLSSY